MIPLRTADGGKQNGVRRLRQSHVGLADRDAMRVIGGAADEAPLDLEIDETLAVQKRRDFLDLPHDFGADAVARKQRKAYRSAWFDSSRPCRAGRELSLMSRIPSFLSSILSLQPGPFPRPYAAAS